MIGQRWPVGCVGAILFALCTRWRHGLERFEVRHESRDLSLRKLEHWHLRMDSLSQGPLQVLNGILEMQCAERRRDGERTFADCFDGTARNVSERTSNLAVPPAIVRGRNPLRITQLHPTR